MGPFKSKTHINILSSSMIAPVKLLLTKYYISPFLFLNCWSGRTFLLKQTSFIFTLMDFDDDLQI